MQALFLTLVVLAAAPVAPTGKAGWDVRDAVPLDTFIVQAHRGAGELAEENSLEAFQLGWRLHCIPEADVRTTRDSVIVAFHDNNFARVVKDVSPEMSKRSVKDVTFDELQKLDIGSFKGEQFAGRRVPRLADVFALMREHPERRLYLDIKDVDLPKLAAEAKSHRVEKQVIFASTKYDLIRGWRKLVPDGQTLLWMGGTEEKLNQRFDELRKADFADVTQVQVHTHLPEGVKTIARDAADPFTVSDAFLKAHGEELRTRGILYQTLPYGGTTREIYWKLLDLGFMSFATDHPEVTWAAVREYYKLPPMNADRRAKIDAALAASRDTRALEMGSGVLADVPEVFHAQFPAQRAVIVGDANTMRVAGRNVAEMLRSAGSPPPFVFTDSDLYAEQRFVERLQESLASHGAIPVAVGSGTINDVVKLAAHRTGRQYLCVATAASMDGYTAYGSSITFKGSKQTFDCPAPRAVVADIDVIRAVPPGMTASGYADLLAKLTAGADWIVADMLGVEPIHPQAWQTVQGDLAGSLADPVGARNGDPAAIERLTHGLMMGGFAMQATMTSRPASGAEHQFSHLWDMQHHTHAGVAPSHGFKVGVATLAVAKLYEALYAVPLDRLDVERAVSRWPSWKDTVKAITAMFDVDELRDKAVEQTRAKYVTREALRDQLARLKDVGPQLVARLREYLPPAAAIERMLNDAGATTKPESIGISPRRLRDSFRLAYHIRLRYTVLDLCERAAVLDECLDRTGIA